jgi:hypothetical protein
VLKRHLQTAYHVVRGGVQVEVSREDLSFVEMAVLIEELRRLGREAHE